MDVAGTDKPSDANGAGPSARDRTGLFYLPPTAQRAAIAAVAYRQDRHQKLLDARRTQRDRLTWLSRSASSAASEDSERPRSRTPFVTGKRDSSNALPSSSSSLRVLICV